MDRVEIHDASLPQYSGIVRKDDGIQEGDEEEEEEKEREVEAEAATYEQGASVFNDFHSETRRSVRQRVPNSRYATEYVSSSISSERQRIISPIREVSPPKESPFLTTKPPIPPPRKKRTNAQPINSPIRPSDIGRNKVYATNIGTLRLRWPRFGVHSVIHEGRLYSVTNTCPLDTGLFILYHAYKSGGSKFQDLFETDPLPIFTTLRRTFQLVESDNWDIARPIKGKNNQWRLRYREYIDRDCFPIHPDNAIICN